MRPLGDPRSRRRAARDPAPPRSAAPSIPAEPVQLLGDEAPRRSAGCRVRAAGAGVVSAWRISAALEGSPAFAAPPCAPTLQSSEAAGARCAARVPALASMKAAGLLAVPAHTAMSLQRRVVFLLRSRNTQAQSRTAHSRSRRETFARGARRLAVGPSRAPCCALGALDASECPWG